MADNENTILTEENESTRIINLSEASEMDSGMYFVTDSSNGTRKVPITKLIDADLEDEYAAAPAKAVGDLKEDFNALETEVSTLSDAVTLSTYNNDQVPYLFRASGGGKYIGGIEKDTIVGGTVAWNQLCNGSSVTVPNGHKYYMVKGGTASIGASTGTAITGLTSGTDIITDLTQMFGSTIADYIYTLEQATAGSGVAKLKSWGFFTEDYYPYDSGSLKSVESLTSHDMVGFNQWDEEWELGSINTSGADTTATDRIRSKAYIPCFPNASYYVKTPVGLNFRFYDESKTIISYSTYMNTVFTTPANCRYMRFASSSGHTVYANDICINLSSSRNGQYEPYIKHSYALDSDLTLRGIPKLDSANQLYYDGDVYASDGSVTRKYQYADPSDRDTYSYNTSAFSTSSAGVPYIDLATKYRTVSGNQTVSNKYIWIGSSVTGYSGAVKTNSYSITIYDSRFTSLSQAIDLLSQESSVFVVPMFTPTTETATPYQTPQLVDKNGTEEYVTTGIVPVGHDTEYYLDADSVLTPPTEDGTYFFNATVADGETSYAWGTGGGGGVTVDSALSTASTNPVQNKVITNALNGKAGTSTATTSANGLMSSTDKGRLDDLYADYSSALTALGVI